MCLSIFVAVPCCSLPALSLRLLHLPARRSPIYQERMGRRPRLRFPKGIPILRLPPIFPNPHGRCSTAGTRRIARSGSRRHEPTTNGQRRSRRAMVHRGSASSWWAMQRRTEPWRTVRWPRSGSEPAAQPHPYTPTRLSEIRTARFRNRDSVLVRKSAVNLPMDEFLGRA
ncbi:MAG: hypothetical protein MNPFHGCM_00556 [Gemmatimonadaceae bacterium]|nr:hypothetical protein [Gemmatimonadaceae bacterium]